MDDLERRRRRLRRARVLIRVELVMAFAVPLLAGFLWIEAPGFMGGPMFYEPPLIERLLPWAAVVGVVWMVRLSRPDPEAGERTWRYRAF